MTRIAYKTAKGRRLTTEAVYRTAEEAHWPLYQPEEDYVPEYNRMRTLEIETHMGEVTLRKKGNYWTQMEVSPDSDGDVALMEILGEDLFVPDFERSTNWN